MTRHAGRGLLCVLILGAAAPPAAQDHPPAPPLELFLAATSANERAARAAVEQLAHQWRDGYTPMIIDMARQLRFASPVNAGSTPEQSRTPNDTLNLDESGGPGGDSAGSDLGSDVARRPTRESLVRARLIRFLETQTGKRFDIYLTGWRHWMWSLPYDPHPDYARFKGIVYGRIDPRMQRFFPPDARALIRLDEIDWGGVTVNGIPPLDHPKVLNVADATFMRDSNVVFGVAVNGEARAYPKRILAWHEMALDRLGGTEITVVYCTLCGTVIPYDSLVGGRLRRLGTSGLLYRSNKLMFDDETMSLWSTLEGTPVVGPLVGTGLQMTSHAAVTTTWAEWRAEHPDTTVLSLDTGHARDYREGAAYRDYFSNDRLYFQVSRTDPRLKNKTEMLVLKVKAAAGGETQPVALVADFLKKNPVFQFEAAGRRFVVVTTPRGANRVYALNGNDVVFPAQAASADLVDSAGGRWSRSEAALAHQGGEGALPRYTAQRAFWFGWYAQYPNTLLIGR